MASRRDHHPRATKRKIQTGPEDPEITLFRISSQLVGKGSYSAIWVAQSLMDSSLKVAVKVSKKTGQRAKLNYESAMGSLRMLQHPNIIRLFFAQETALGYYEFMEHLEKPTMTLTALLERAEQSIPTVVISPIVSQLASALAHMHERGVGHRDVKPDNIMINPQTLHVTLIDFGFAMSTRSSCEDFVGSPIYAAPEVLTFQPYAVDLADVWSLGVVIFQLCFGAYPWPAQTLPELTARVVRENLQFPPTPSQDVRILQPLIAALLQKAPHARLPATVLAANLHPFQSAETIRQNSPTDVEEEDAMEITTS